MALSKRRRSVVCLMKSDRGTLWRRWLPALLWMLVIFGASTDLMSAEHTSRFIAPFLQWFDPNVSPATVLQVQFAVRKAAHLTEYAILAALLVRALRGEAARPTAGLIACAIAVAAVWAVLDEYHQSFVPSRTSSPIDVMIDTAGAVLGVAIYCWLVRSGVARARSKIPS